MELAGAKNWFTSKQPAMNYKENKLRTNLKTGLIVKTSAALQVILELVRLSSVEFAIRK